MALTYPQNGDLTKSLKSARKKVPQSALLRAGGGVQSLFGQCPNRGGTIFKGASLSLPSGSDILRYICICQASAIYGLPINLLHIYKRVSSLLTMLKGAGLTAVQKLKMGLSD